MGMDINRTPGRQPRNWGFCLHLFMYSVHWHLERDFVEGDECFLHIDLVGCIPAHHMHYRQFSTRMVVEPAI